MSQLSVNCSKKSALILEGCKSLAVALMGVNQAHCIASAGGDLTVNVGFSIAGAVLVSSIEMDEDSAVSSVSSARTWPRRAAEE